MMTYCTLTKSGDGTINGVHVVKQVALVSESCLRLCLLRLICQINGRPFELKSIYGLTNEEGA